MAQLTAQSQPRVARRSPLEFVVDRIWRFLCSVRAAVYEIMFLTVLVLLGTLRGSSVPRSLADLLPVTEPLVDRWYAWDVFHSLPFMGILTLLAVAITVCTLNRAPAIWRTIAHPTVTTSHGFLRGAEVSARFDAPAPPVAFATDLVGVLKARRYRVLTEQRGDETHVYADKNRYAKLGTFPFHLALIMILIGGVVGARYGFRIQELIVPEGATRAIGHGTGLSVGLNEFTDSYTEIGQPAEFTSALTLYKDGKPVKDGTITVNHPMTHGSVVIYQASFGQAVRLKITNAAGLVLFEDGVDLGIYHSSTNPDAPAGILDLPMAGVQLNIIAPDTNRANAPLMDDLRLRSGEMYIKAVPKDPTNTAASGATIIRQGQPAQLGGLTIDFISESQFTLLQVARNPGIPIFFAAALLLVGGLAITFYFPHRRVRGIIAASPAGSTATFAPLAKRDWSGQRDFHRLLAAFEERLGVAPVVTTSERVDSAAGGHLRRSGKTGAEGPV